MRDSTLWYPDLPMPHLKFTGTPLNRECNDIALPASLVLFGGAHGHDLQLVTGLTIWQPQEWDDESERPLWAFEVSFSNGRPPMYFGPEDPDTHKERCKFAIDGPGGERITGFEPVVVNDWTLGFRVRKPCRPFHYSNRTDWCSRSKQTGTEPLGSPLQLRWLTESTCARTAGRPRSTTR